MITEIPQAADFRKYGIDYLNLGWGTLTEILEHLANAEEWMSGMDPSTRDEYWKAAERELGTALSLTEQGVEFLLKARICAVSPWLLTTGELPKKSDVENIPFSQFRTIDAQDLLRTHNTFSDSRLPPEFATTFEALRKQRNSIMHTVDLNLKLTIPPLLTDILLVSEHLIGPKAWVRTRKDFIDRDRHSTIESDYNETRLAREFMQVIALLKPAPILHHFGFNKGRRCYICPNCSDGDSYFEATTAQLKPNTPASIQVYCFICDSLFPVTRRDCVSSDCQGNVIWTEDDQCLTCGDHIPEES
jgi:hypothetical protein